MNGDDLLIVVQFTAEVPSRLIGPDGRLDAVFDEAWRQLKEDVEADGWRRLKIAVAADSRLRWDVLEDDE